MNSLARHIEVLLLHNDCVVVPQLGGFVAYHTTATYDEGEQIFIPPLRTIGFNRQLNINDSQLIQSYVEAYDISYQEARDVVDSEVEKLKIELGNHGKYDLHGVGLLCVNRQGKIEFEPSMAGIITPDFYGLHAIEIPLLHKESTASDEKKSTSTPKELNILKVNRQEKLMRRTVAAAIVILAIMTFALIPSSSKRHAEIQSTMIPSVVTSPNTVKTKPKTPTSKPSIHSLSVSSSRIQPVAKSTTNKSAPYYCIVLASDVQKKNAQLFVEQMRQQGYEYTRLLEGKQKLKIIYGTFPTHEMAQDTLRKFQSISTFSQSWIMKVE